MAQAQEANAGCSWTSSRTDATRALARALAQAASAVLGDDAFAIGLVGPLGAGKTEFAKGLGEGLGIDAEAVASPTFVIASSYPLEAGDGAAAEFVHVDFYRLESAGELEALGFDDWLEPGTLLAVEWADRFPRALPGDRLELTIERVAASGGAGLAGEPKVGKDSGPAKDPNGAEGAGAARRVRARATGPRAASVLDAWAVAVRSVDGLQRDDED